MDYSAFVQSLIVNLPAGLVMDNLGGRGTSTVMWCRDGRICYKRGKSRLYVDLRNLYEGYRQHAGGRLTTSDLKATAPTIFDSKQNGHGCHCTFLLMALERMGVVGEIHGAGRAGDPFWVLLPAR